MSLHSTRRTFLLGSLTTALAGTGVAGATPGRGRGRGQTESSSLRRFSTTALGAEYTGVCLTADGTLFFNVQHPDASNPAPYDHGAVGVLEGFRMDDLPESWTELSLPGTSEEKGTIRTKFGTHRVLANGGDTTDDGEALGVPYSADGDAMTDGNNPDFNSYVPFDEHGDEGYLYTNWETAPGMISRLHIRRGSDGSWTVLGLRNLADEVRAIEGTWNNCFGSRTPWGTPLSAEEYEPVAEAWFRTDQQTYGNREVTMADYLGYFGNAYRYGYLVEITDPLDDSPVLEKRFAMGRFSHENAIVMPNNRTAYLTDDGTGVVLFRFEADRARDLSAGTLYAAKLTQDAGSAPATVGFDIEWVELGHATDSEIESWIAEYDGQSADETGDYLTDDDVAAWAAGEAADDRVAFLESREAAAAKGATDEWRKMEGIAVRPNARVGDSVYVAMSEINETMLENGAAGAVDDPEDDIALERNDYGALYRMPIEGGFDVSRIEPAIAGTEDTFWNLDNVVVMDDGRVVMGEDSDHENNQLWVYDPGEN